MNLKNPMLKKFISLLVTLSLSIVYLFAQHAQHGSSPTYTYPKEPQVLEKLEEWRDLKFGLIIHWGLYSELGIVESWSICAEEEDWIPRDSTISYDSYKRDYWSVADRFNPVNFDPESWASTAARAGMKYLVFTTKHHDGFCMFDTKQTDFSITKRAFAHHPRNNVAKEVFDAFRKEDFMIGAYFSKPDWHSQYYWWDRYSTPNRNNNYNIANNPWRWEQFKNYTYNQIEEIVNGDYGEIDILWLDGGWVRPSREGDRERAGRAYRGDQNIDMPRIARMVRSYHPDMLIVDRTVPGEFENYMTPERGVPEIKLDNPWESCIPLGNDWGYVPTDIYKSPETVINTLVEIVAKGGNMLLGIGPKADGTLPEEVVSRLEKIGEWLQKNGEAIYNTRPVDNYNDGDIWKTQSADGKWLYTIICFDPASDNPETIILPESINTPLYDLQTSKKVKSQTRNGQKVISLTKKRPDPYMPIVFKSPLN